MTEKTQEQLDQEALEAQQAKDAKAAEKAAAKAKKEQEAADKKAAKLEAKKAEQEARDAAAATKKAEREASKLEQNGVTRPLSGATKQVWDFADAISAETKAPAERAKVMERAKAAGLQEGTINTQYGRWRKYHGLVAVREAKPKAPAAPTAPSVPEAPAGE